MFGAEYVSALNNTSMLSVRSGQIDKSNQSYNIFVTFYQFLAFCLKLHVSDVASITSKQRFTSMPDTYNTWYLMFSKTFVYDQYALLPSILFTILF